MTMWNLTGQRALVTGASRGIGLAIAQMLAERGAEVWLNARRPELLDEAVAGIREQGGQACAVAGDISQATERKAVLATVAENNTTLDILVNNAGFNIRKPALAYTGDELHSILETNLVSAFELARAAHPLLSAANQASVVNISSVAGLTHLRTGAPYAMSKAALHQMTRNLAVEWAAEGVRVNAIAPWYIDTPLARQVLSDSAYLSAVLERTPLKRIGKAEEVAGAVVFLCLPIAGYITGQVLAVDGGFSINGF